jgi:hypothetical protein
MKRVLIGCLAMSALGFVAMACANQDAATGTAAQATDVAKDKAMESPRTRRQVQSVRAD